MDSKETKPIGLSRRKTKDPALIAMLDEKATQVGRCESAYAKLKRSFGRLEAARRKLANILRRIKKYEQQQSDKPVSLTAKEEAHGTA